MGLRVILDTNVWAYIADADESDALEQLEERLAVRIVVPPSLLLEALRTPDAEIRHRIVHAMTRRGAERVHPSTEARQQVDEFVAEIRRLRPRWMRPFAHTADIAGFEKFWTKRIWQEAARDPDRSAAAYGSTPMNAEVQEWLDVQVENKQAFARTGRPVLEIEPTVTLADQASDARLGWEGDRLPFWRVHASWRWWIVVSGSGPRPSSHQTFRDWLDPWVLRDVMKRDREGWNRLWFYELESSRMARTWITEILPWAQLMAKVGGGNPRDVQHAAYLFAADVFLTADRRLVNALELVRAWAPAPFAAVHRIGGPPASPTDALAAVLAAERA